MRAQSNSRSLRSRHVKIDFSLLGDTRGLRRGSHKGKQSLEPLELNLFDDASYTAILDKIEPHAKGYSWIGRVQGTEHSIVILTVRDNVMAGNVSVLGTSFQIRHTATGVHSIREVDPEAVRPDGEPIQVEFGPDGTAILPPAIARDSRGKWNGSPDRTPFLSNDDVSLAVSPVDPSLPQLGSGDFFDLLVVYTAAARAAAGGTAGIESLIQLGVTETNLAYQNSGIIPRLRLVHTKEVNYTEWGNIETDLAHLILDFVDDTHAVRNAYGADLVRLITDSSASVCGLANVMSGNNPGFSEWAYSVVEQSCISPNYSFGHELAHNMGSNHAPGDPLNNGAFPYSLGYKDPSDQFRTLMAYNTG